MAFCGYCGTQVPDDMRFCVKCGKPISGTNPSAANGGPIPQNNKAPTGQNPNINYGNPYAAQNPNIARNPNIAYGPANGGISPAQRLEELERHRKEEAKEARRRNFYEASWMIPLALLFLCCLVYFSDPPALTITLSAVIIAGAICIFIFRLKGKIMAVIALVAGIYCMCCGFIQGVKWGFDVTPDREEVVSEFSSGNSSSSHTSSSSTSSSTHNTSSSSNSSSSSGSVNSSNSGSNNSSSSSGSSSSGRVDPNLKAFLDEYEDFMDDYIAFMKKYTSDTSNVMSMMNDYMAMLQKYEDYMTKLDKYDAGSMSSADLEYYMEVTARVEKKLLSIY